MPPDWDRQLARVHRDDTDVSGGREDHGSQNVHPINFVSVEDPAVVLRLSLFTTLIQFGQAKSGSEVSLYLCSRYTLLFLA